MAKAISNRKALLAHLMAGGVVALSRKFTGDGYVWATETDQGVGRGAVKWALDSGAARATQLDIAGDPMVIGFNPEYQPPTKGRRKAAP